MFKCGYCGAEFETQEEATSHIMRHAMEQAQRQQQEVMQTYLLLAASQLTQICLISGRKPEEAIELFSRLYELLKDWRGGVESKEGFIKWLENQWGRGGGDQTKK